MADIQFENMKVIFITSESFIDHSFTMARELKKHIDLDVIFIAKETSPEIDDFCRKLNARFMKRRRFASPLSLVNEFKLLRYIKKQKADLVWFNTLTLFQSLLVKFYIKYLLVNIHDVEYHPADINFHGRFSQKLTFSFFKNSVAAMSFTQAEIFEKFSGFKPHVLRLPIIDYYEASAGAKKNTKQNSERVRFLFFGSILPYKGIEKLLCAAEILEIENYDFELNIYGKLMYHQKEITDKINKLKKVILNNKFIDYKDVYNIYENNDVVIIPYNQVTQCGPLLIGYNQGMPCITSNLPGFREFVEDGKSGLLFDNTCEGLAKKMLEFINNPGKINEMRTFTLNNIMQRFSMQALANSYLAVFRTILTAA